ncbi:MAG: hypothetical protein J6C23_00220 [Clostridia bacterium]|nr:hypothetical protein [Clostridia bacterium]
MSDAESKILEQIYKYYGKKGSYEKILRIFAEQEQNPTVIYRLITNLSPSLGSLGRYYGVTPEEESAFVRKHEIRAIECYQRALEYNYELLRQYKETGVEPDNFSLLVMTVDEDDNPKKTRVVDVKGGRPVFEDGCKIKTIDGQMNQVGSLINDLHKWINKDGTLQEKLDKAMKLKEQGALGAQTPPNPNYDLDGLVGGQLDAMAWQNYAIEMGMVKTVDYDFALKQLIGYLKICIEFYEQAISIV